jgi:hypothetical protein
MQDDIEALAGTRPPLSLPRSDQVPQAAPEWRAVVAEARPDAAWDAAVEAAGGDLVQTTAWAEVRQRLGFRVLHLRLLDEAGGLHGGCVMQLRRLAPGIWAGAVPRGPVAFDAHPGLAQRLVTEMLAMARRARVRLLVAQPGEPAGPILAAMAEAGFRPGGPAVAPSATLRTDPRLADAELMRRMNSNRRRILRAIAPGTFETVESDDVEAFHRLYVESARRQGFPPITLDNLRAQWAVLAPRGLCRLYLTYHEGKPIAGEWLTRFGGTMTVKLRGNDVDTAGPAARSAPTASMWNCLLAARAQGARCVDLGGFDRGWAELLLAGGKPSAEFNATHSYFKWSFGGELVLLPGPHFILPGRIGRALLTGAAHRVLTTPWIQRLAQRIRASR